MLAATANPTQEEIQRAFESAPEGGEVLTGTHEGHQVVLKKVDGKPVVDSERTSDAPTATDFCHTAALGAVFVLGGAGLAFLAATGGGWVAGIFVGAEGCAKLAAAMTAGAGISSLVSAYIC